MGLSLPMSGFSCALPPKGELECDSWMRVLNLPKPVFLALYLKNVSRYAIVIDENSEVAQAGFHCALPPKGEPGCH